MNLHKDDIDVLYYIHKTLGFGEVRSYKDYSSFTVTRLKDIAQLLNIFAPGAELFRVQNGLIIELRHR